MKLSPTNTNAAANVSWIVGVDSWTKRRTFRKKNHCHTYQSVEILTLSVYCLPLKKLVLLIYKTRHWCNEFQNKHKSLEGCACPDAALKTTTSSIVAKIWKSYWKVFTVKKVFEFYTHTLLSRGWCNFRNWKGGREGFNALASLCE